MFPLTSTTLPCRLRHTYAYTLCNELLLANEEKRRAGTSTFDVQGTVQEHMRHAHPETTDIYLKKAKRERALFSVRVNALYDKYLEAI